MEQIKISAKNLGAVAMPDFCPRCFWIKLKTANKLPWQIFPGIFSSIDAYTKHCVHAMIKLPTLPGWLKYACPAWADQFYKEWCDLMVAREIEVKEQPKFKKIAGGKK